MEELKATQEEVAKQAEQFISFTNSVNHTLIRAEYDTEGFLIYANTRFLIKMGYSGNREVEGKHISTFIHEKDRDWFNNLWGRLFINKPACKYWSISKKESIGQPASKASKLKEKTYPARLKTTNLKFLMMVNLL